MSTAPPSSVAHSRPSGAWIVTGMIVLGVALAAFAIGYQWMQTRRCLSFYGSETAHRIQTAPRVELWRLDPNAQDLPPPADRRTDVSQARGLVHLRRGLVEDANFAWERSVAEPPTASVALAFFDRASDPEPGTLLVVELDASGGTLAVAGRPEAVALGRIAGGLRKWLADAAPRP